MRGKDLERKMMKSRKVKVLLAVGVLFVFLIGATTLFTSFSGYTLTVDDVVISSGATFNEGDGSFKIKFLPGITHEEEPTELPEDMQNSGADLICVENDANVGSGTAGFTVEYMPQGGGEPGTYDLHPYFAMDMSGVYKGTHSYKIVVSGDIVGTSFTFNIVGDNDSPVYPEDGNGNGNGNGNGTVPTEPEFIETPDDATFEISTPSNETLTWVVEDDNLAHYYLYFNDTLLADGAIILDEFTYVVEIFDYGIGVYVFEFVVVDGDNNTILDEVTITVVEEGEMPSDIMKWIEDNPLIAAGIGIIVLFLFVGGSSAKGREIIVIKG